MGGKLGPQFQAAGVIHGEHLHGGATGGRNPLDTNAEKQKMLSPAVAPGVEEGHKLTTDGIHAREVGALAKVAAVAGQREIFNVIAPAVLFGDDMLNVVRQLAVLLAQQAILATVIRPAPDKVSRGGVHR
jgi:hypothetical protein